MVGGLLSIGAIDVLDILLVAFIIYWVLLFIRGTRAVQMLFGLLFLMVMYVVAKKAGMVTFQWLVGNFLENLLVVLVVVFQSEIRRGLARIGQWRLIGRSGSAPDPDVIDQLAQCAFLLAQERTGAILLLEREMLRKTRQALIRRFLQQVADGVKQFREIERPFNQGINVRRRRAKKRVGTV